MVVTVVNKSNNDLPEYETPGAAGLDVRANADFYIHPGAIQLVPTGLFVEIPPGYEIQVRPRSGLALKHGITVLNSPGTIDSDYRGEIGVILINHGKEPFDISPGDRIAQLVLCKVERIEWDVNSALTGTFRGKKGFGSTGK